MGTTTPLIDQIREGERRREADLRYLHPDEPVEFTPRWLRRLTARDFTDSIYSNGTWQPRGGSRGA